MKNQDLSCGMAHVLDSERHIEEELVRSEQALLERYFIASEVTEFCSTHRVEVLIQDDTEYHCYIDYKQGSRSWYSTLRNPFTAMVIGIKKYKEHECKNTQ